MITKHESNLLVATLVGVVTLMVFALHPIPAGAQASTDSPLVRQIYNGEWMAKEDQQKFEDDFLFQRVMNS